VQSYYENEPVMFARCRDSLSWIWHDICWAQLNGQTFWCYSKH